MKLKSLLGILFFSIPLIKSYINFDLLSLFGYLNSLGIVMSFLKPTIKILALFWGKPKSNEFNNCGGITLYPANSNFSIIKFKLFLFRGSARPLTFSKIKTFG